MVGNTNLYEYYRTTFFLMYRLKWSLSDIERLVPFELDIYLNLLTNQLEMEKQLQQSMNNR